MFSSCLELDYLLFVLEMCLFLFLLFDFGGSLSNIKVNDKADTNMSRSFSVVFRYNKYQKTRTRRTDLQIFTSIDQEHFSRALHFLRISK